MCRNRASIDPVQLSSLDDDVSDESDEEEEELRSSLLLRLESPEIVRFELRVGLELCRIVHE